MSALGRLVNIALIPYVWLRFPGEASAYARRCFGRPPVPDGSGR